MKDVIARSYLRENLERAARFDRWLETLNYSPHTRRNYGAAVREFCQFIGGKALAGVEHLDIRAFLAHLMQRGLAPSSLARQLIALRTFFDFLQLGGLVSFCAPRMIANRKVSKRLPRFLTPKQVERLIQAARTPRERALLEFAYATGCRTSELSALNVEDVEWEKPLPRPVLIKHGKGNRTRVVLLGSKADAALRDYLSDRRSGPLFLTEHAGQRLTVRQIDRIVADAGRRAGLGRIWPLVLRHSFATAMLTRGADLRSVQDLMGHADVATTCVYLHLTIDNLRDTLKRYHPRG